MTGGASAPGADHDPPTMRVAHRIRYEVAQDPLDQHRIGPNDSAASLPDEGDAVGLCFFAVVMGKALEHRADGKRPSLDNDDSRIEF